MIKERPQCVGPESDDSSARRVLPQRSTRGQRLHQLVGDELEADASFWNQEALQEEADEDEFHGWEMSESSSDEEAIDSSDDAVDIERRSASTEERAAKEAEREARRTERLHLVAGGKRRARFGKYIDPAIANKTPRPTIQREKQAQKEPTEYDPNISAKPSHETSISVSKDRLRRSTKLASREAALERERKHAEASERARQIRERLKDQGTDVRTISQEERLLEATQTTEPANLLDLQRLLRHEEKTKTLKKSHSWITRPVHGSILWHTSSRESSTENPTCRENSDWVTLPCERDTWVAFRTPQDVPPFLLQNTDRTLVHSASQSSSEHSRQLCVVSGKPARYRDRLTCLPFADVSAYLKLRQHPEQYLNMKTESR